MHDRRQSGRKSTVAVEDVISREIPADDLVDDEYLREVFGDPSRHVSPPAREPDPESREPDQPSPEPESTFARRAKLAALFLAACLVAASLAVAATLARRGEERETPPSDPLRITGAAALGGFAVPGDPHRSGQHDASTPVSAPREHAATAAQRIRDTQDTQGARDTDTATGSPGTTAEGDGGDSAVETVPADTTTSDAVEATATTEDITPAETDKLAVARSFYGMVDTAPNQALGMLDPALATGADRQLLRAWRALDAVRIDDLREDAGGMVRAVVTFLYANGERLRLTQVLAISDSPGGLISDAVLVSAQPG